MAKESRFRYSYRNNASKLHKSIGNLLRNHYDFCGHTSFQEYPVNKVNPSFSSGAHKFDWVVPGLRLVIECHGKQHYEPVAFGGDNEKALDDFRDTKYRDKIKKEAALAVNWRYIIVSFTEQNRVTGRLIFDKIKEADEELCAYQLEHFEDINEISTSMEMAEGKARTKAYRREKQQKHLASPFHKEQLKQQSNYRKKQRRKYKEFRNES